MARVSLDVPRVLRDSVDGRARLDLEADRLDGLAAEIRRRWPTLATHVFTEAGELRPHVLLLHDDRLLPRGPLGGTRLTDGDRLEIVQAVSGG